jgi:uncharacterized protein (DUF2141 family)
MPHLTSLIAFPNPAIEDVTIEFGSLSGEDIQVRIFDSVGRKVQAEVRMMRDKVTISRGNLKAGNYQVLVIHQDGRSGAVSFVFE